MQPRVSEFSAISGLLRRSDEEIAAEMAKVKDFKRLASQLSLYDDQAMDRIIKGLPPENRVLVRRMTQEMKNPLSWAFSHNDRMRKMYGRFVYESTHLNLKKILPSLILALVLLAISGYII